MPSKNPSKSGVAFNEARLWLVTIFAALLGAVLFLRPYLGTIALAALVAYLFNPFYKYLLRKTRQRKTFSLTLTTLMSFVSVLVPLAVILVAASVQLLSLVENLGLNDIAESGTGLYDFVNEIAAWINDLSEQVLGVKDLISQTEINQFVGDTLPNIADALFGLVVGLASGIAAFFEQFIIYIFVFTGILANQHHLARLASAISPFDSDLDDTYKSRAGAMAKAMFRGQLVIAACQGLVSALSLAVLGLQEYLLFFAVVFSFMNLIPLGSGIVTIPLGIGALLFGNVVGGLVILLTHFLVVTNIDNFLRPRLVPKNARLPAALTMLSAFAGVSYFGLMGVIYGPIIMIVITTTIESYVAYRSKVAA